MAYEIFCIELPSGKDSLLDLNRFLATHRVISKQQFLQSRDGVPYMIYSLEYVEGSGMTGRPAPEAGSRTDVWDGLDAEQREVYDRLRELRKSLAEQEHIKPFVIFTNEQLGEMVKKRISSLEGLKGIKDIGKSRMEKYAPLFVPVLKEIFSDVNGESTVNHGNEPMRTVAAKSERNADAPGERQLELHPLHGQGER